MRIDHVILQCRDLDATAERLVIEEDLGSVAGGVHSAWGTANRIVPAGESYLELMGIGDHAAAEESDLGRWLLSGTEDGDRLAAVCLRTDDLDGVCARLGLTASEGKRTTPEGKTISWRSAGMDQMIANGLPFFISWDGPTGADVEDPEQGARATDLVGVELGGDAQGLAAWIGEDVPGLVLVGGEQGVRSVQLTTPSGPVVLVQPDASVG